MLYNIKLETFLKVRDDLVRGLGHFEPSKDCVDNVGTDSASDLGMAIGGPDI